MTINGTVSDVSGINSLSGSATTLPGGNIYKGGATIGTGQNGTEGQAAVSATFNEVTNTNTFVGSYTSRDGNPAEGIAPSTTAKVTVTDAPTGTTIDARTTFPINGDDARGNASITHNTGTQTTNVAAGVAWNEYNSVQGSVTTSPVGTTAVVDGRIGNAGENFGVGATVSSVPGVGNEIRGSYNFNQGDDKTGTQVAATAAYNTLTGVTAGATVATGDPNAGGRFTGSVDYTQATNDFSAKVGYQLGGSSPAPQPTAAQLEQRLDSGLADYKIGQLTGTDRTLYQDALAGVRQINQNQPEGSKLPERETALSIAAAADKAGLTNISDMKLGNVTADGKQNIFYSNTQISDNPSAAPPLSMDKATAANTPALQNIDSLAENNLRFAPITPQNANTQAANVDNQEVAPRQLAGR